MVRAIAEVPLAELFFSLILGAGRKIKACVVVVIRKRLGPSRRRYYL